MIDAERMLGSLVRNAMGGRGRRRKKRRGRRGRRGIGLGKGALGMGALGVAIAAFEHFTSQQQGSSFDGGRPAPPASGSGTGDAAPLPPLPGQAAQVGVPLPPLPGAESEGDDALLLVRAMIAAANADHELDDDERARIMDALAESGLAAEERSYLEAQIESPISLDELTAAAGTPDRARQVYLASLMAIDVDSDAERNYLSRLAGGLNLTPEQVAELESFLDDDETDGDA